MHSLAAAAPLQLTASPGTQAAGRHQPIRAELALWNTGPTPLELVGGQALDGMTSMRIVLPDGRTENLGRPKWARGADVMSGGSRVKIAPGQAYRQVMLLHDWFPFESQGRYTITLSVYGAELSVTLYVDIGPRDEAALKAQCEKLIETAFLLRHPERTLSARALANMQDPVAVPFLERLAGTFGLDDQYARAALFEMGTPAAIHALKAAVSRGSPLAALEVREQLRKLQASSPNPEVRQAAAEVLTIRRRDDPTEAKP